MHKQTWITALLGLSLLTACAPATPATTTAAGTTTAVASDTPAPQTSTGNGAPLKKVTFLLDWTPNTNHTGLFVAKDKGYFAEAGLDVDIQTPPQGGSPALVAAGKADFGIDFQDTLAPALASPNPLPVTAVAAVLQHNTSGIISRKGEGLDRPAGLAEKKYATWDNPVEQAIIRSVVEGDGGDYAKVQLIPNNITDEVAALKTKQVDAVWIFYGWSGINAKVQDFAFDYFAFKDLDPVFDYYTPVIITADSLIESDPETVRAFVAAAGKGYTWSAQNPAEAAGILMKYAPELDEALTRESQAWMTTQLLEPGKPWGRFEAARWDGFYQWLWDNRLIEQSIPAGKGFTNDFIGQ